MSGDKNKSNLVSKPLQNCKQVCRKNCRILVLAHNTNWWKTTLFFIFIFITFLKEIFFFETSSVSLCFKKNVHIFAFEDSNHRTIQKNKKKSLNCVWKLNLHPSWSWRFIYFFSKGKKKVLYPTMYIYSMWVLKTYRVIIIVGVEGANSVGSTRSLYCGCRRCGVQLTIGKK